MNRDNVQHMLRFIEAADRRPFPDGAADVWAALLESVDADDAMTAVHEHFRLNDKGTLMPAAIRTRAIALADARKRVQAATAAIGPAPAYTPPNAEFRAALGRVAARVGDLGRPRTVRVDTSRPTVDAQDAVAMEASRRAQLAALDRMVAA